MLSTYLHPHIHMHMVTNSCKYAHIFFFSSLKDTQTHTHTLESPLLPGGETWHCVAARPCTMLAGPLLVVLVIQAAVMRRRGTNRLQALWECHAWCQAATILWRKEQTVSCSWQGGEGGIEAVEISSLHHFHSGSVCIEDWFNTVCHSNSNMAYLSFLFLLLKAPLSQNFSFLTAICVFVS